MKILIDFKIKGVGTNTGKKRERIYSGCTKEEAIKNALADGTTPKEIIELPQEPATQKQLNFAKELGLTIPVNPTLRLLSSLISEALERKKTPFKKRSITKKAVVAPSGFEFPVFPYTSSTIVRIIDRTDYRNDFLSVAYDKKTYDQQDFEHDLEPYVLDIEVEEFDIMFKPSTLKNLGINKPPTGWVKFHQEVRYMEEDGEDLIWPMTKPIHKQLVKLGLCRLLPETNESKATYFQSFTVKQLKEICSKHNLKKSGSKIDIINRIITNGKHKAKPSCTLTSKYNKKVLQLAKIYLTDITKQLKNKPEAYSVVVWEQVLSGPINNKIPSKIL